MKFNKLNEAIWQRGNLNDHFAKHVLNVIYDKAAIHDSNKLLMRDFGDIDLLAQGYKAYSENLSVSPELPIKGWPRYTKLELGKVYGCRIRYKNEVRNMKCRLLGNGLIDLVIYSLDGSTIITCYRTTLDGLHFILDHQREGDILELKPEEEKSTEDEINDEV